MPIIPEYDDQIIAETRKLGVIQPRQIAAVARRHGHEFLTSDYSWGWSTAKRLCRNGRMVRVGRARYSAPVLDCEWVGKPVLGDLDPEAMKKIQACLLLASSEMIKIVDDAEGTLQEWMYGCINRCSRDGSFLGVVLDGGEP